jgi:hypothetical protein
MAHVAFVGAGDGIEELGPVQAEHFLTSRDGRLVLDGLVLLPFAHDLSGDTTLFQQLCVFIFRGGINKLAGMLTYHNHRAPRPEPMPIFALSDGHSVL